jgi:thiol-disulfide isomerase/thioredoxin
LVLARASLLFAVLSPLLLAGDAAAPRDGRELVGTKMPALTFDRWIGTADGKPLDTSGRVVLYRWWTSGCAYCEKSLPAIDTLRAKYEADGLTVVGVYHPKPPRDVSVETIKNAATRMGFNGFIAADDTWSQLNRVWLTERRPATSVSILVDGKGVIRFVHPGPALFPSDALEHAAENEAFRSLKAAVEQVLKESEEGRG